METGRGVPSLLALTGLAVSRERNGAAAEGQERQRRWFGRGYRLWLNSRCGRREEQNRKESR
jgi:hypothetical protein